MIYSLLFVQALKAFGGVLLAIAILLTMITIHEFGHYVAGRILGFKINEFSIGFGPAIYKKRSKKTGELFALRCIPLGGYCAFDGEDELVEEKKAKNEQAEEVFPEMQATGESDTNSQPKTENAEGMYALNEPETQTDVQSQAPEQEEKLNVEEEYPEPQGERFNDQPPWKRIIVLVAGALMNYLLALVLIVVLFLCAGRPFYGVQVEFPPEFDATKIPEVLPQENGLQTGDIILEINGENIYLLTDCFDALQGKKKGDVVPVLVLSNGQQVQRTLKLSRDANYKNVADTDALLDSMGIYSLSTETVRSGFFKTLGDSIVYSWKIGGSVLRSLGELLTGKLGLNAMGGPVTTIKVTSEVAMISVESFLNIAAFIGVNLAVFNLLPVPALDGCKVVFCVIEWIRKKPINRKIEAIISIVGLFVLFGFAILVDILQFI